MSLESLAEDEFLLTQVKVRDNSHDDCQLQLRFKGLSDAYVPYHHIYSSVPLSTREVGVLKAFFEQPYVSPAQPNPFYAYKGCVSLVDNYFNILQVKAPRVCSESFQKLRIKSRHGRKEIVYSSIPRVGRKIFHSGYFDRQARWNIEDEANYLQPGVVVRLEKCLIDLLKKKRELDILNRALEKKRRQLSKGLSSGEKSALCGLISRARKNPYAFSSDFSPLLRQIAEKEKEFPEAVYNSNKRCYELFLSERPLMAVQRQLSLDEWLGLRMMFFDIETPKFLKDDFEITHVAVIMADGGKIKRRIVFSRERFSKGCIGGYEVFSGYDSDEEMISHISEFADDADILSAYNINFDVSMMRARGSFCLGEVGDEPKMDVSKKFFERFRLDGGFCIDLLRLGQTVLRGFPNAKLENFSRFLRGMQGYRKKISYDEMEELQYFSEGKLESLSEAVSKKLAEFFPDFETADKRELAKELIISYVCDDAEEMPAILFDKSLIRNCLEDLVWMAENFKLDFTKLLYSPLSLREVFDRGYFKHMGVQRDEIYPKGIKHFQNEINANKLALKNFINSLFGVEPEQGVFHNVERRVVAAGYLLRRYLAQKTHTVHSFMDYVAARSSVCPPHEFIFLSHYVNGIADYMLNDFGGFLRMEKAYEKVLSQLCDARITSYNSLVQAINQQFINCMDRSEILVGTAQRILDRIIEMNVVERKASGRTEQVVPKKISSADLAHLKEIRGFSRVVSGVDPVLNAIVELYEMSALDLYRLFWASFNLKNDIIRVAGNHLVHPKFMKQSFIEEISVVKSALEQNGRILAVNAPYIYFIPSVQSRPLFGRSVPERVKQCFDVNCAPVQAVIKDLYLSDREYSFEDGFYKGVKLKDGPAFYLNAFCSEQFMRALEHLWNERFDLGAEVLIDGCAVLEERVSGADISDEEKARFLFYSKSAKLFFGFQDGRKTEVSSVASFAPDFQMYFDHYVKMAGPFIRPVAQKALVKLPQEKRIFLRKMLESGKKHRVVASCQPALF
jgi:hypothetical protein